jgi:hypothetical protein
MDEEVVGWKLNIRMNNAVLWDVAPYGYCKSRRFGGMRRLYLQGGKNMQARKSLDQLHMPWFSS